MTNPSVKFRPSLSAAQLSYIVQTLDQSPNHPYKQSVLKLLRVFVLKAEHGIVSPSHVVTGRPSIEASLGFSEDETPDASIEVLLQMYEANPSILSRTQMDKVMMYRYTNDLMTPQEEQEYEQQANQSV